MINSYQSILIKATIDTIAPKTQPNTIPPFTNTGSMLDCPTIIAISNSIIIRPAKLSFSFSTIQSTLHLQIKQIHVPTLPK